MNENLHELFSTPIWGFMLHDHAYQSHDYIQAIFDMRECQPTAEKSNMGGYQTHEDLHRLPIFREFVDLLENLGSRCASNRLDRTVRVNVTEMWGNINTPNSSNAAHTHSGDLSGVVWLHFPENSGRLVLINPAVRSDSRPFRSPNYPITPQRMGCIIWPSWLEHYVEINRSTEERVSISFNMTVNSR